VRLGLFGASGAWGQMCAPRRSSGAWSSGPQTSPLRRPSVNHAVVVLDGSCDDAHRRGGVLEAWRGGSERTPIIDRDPLSSDPRTELADYPKEKVLEAAALAFVLCVP